MLGLLLAATMAPTLVWSDEFDGDTLDPTKWEAPDLQRQGYQSWWKPDLVHVRNGMLELHFRHLGHEGVRFTCGGVRTRAAYDPNQTFFEKRYGKFETRVKLHDQLESDLWFAFWMMAGDLGGNNTDSRLGSEIDIFESFHAMRDSVAHAVHWGGYEENHNYWSTQIEGLPQVADGEFHTYGLVWTPEEYIFLFDGEETARVDMQGFGGREDRPLSQGVAQVPGYLKLTVEAAAWAGPTNEWELDAPKEGVVYVDWVRVWDLE